MSQVKESVIHFVNSGGRVSADGRYVFGINGKELRQLPQKSGRNGRLYYRINVKHPTAGKVYPVPVHQIIACLKFGAESFLAATLVRHTNDDWTDNSWDNIAIGTPVDNAMDRPPKDRALHAQRGGKAASRYSDELWHKVRVDHAAGIGYKKLRQKYGIPLGTLSYQLGGGKRKSEFLAKIK